MIPLWRWVGWSRFPRSKTVPDAAYDGLRGLRLLSFHPLDRGTGAFVGRSPGAESMVLAVSRWRVFQLPWIWDWGRLENSTLAPIWVVDCQGESGTLEK